MKRIFSIFCMLLSMHVSMVAFAADAVDNYGFLNAPDGTTWTYTASFEKKYNLYTKVTLSVYNSEKELIGTIIDSLKLEDENMTGINQAEINPLVTQKFFNTDNKYEVMLFLHAQTKNYEGHNFNHVFSIGDGETVTTPVTSVDGRQVYAQNVGDYSENYVMIFARDSASTSKDYTLCYDVRRKSVYGGGVQHTFRIPYANVAALTDLQPIFMFKNGSMLYYVTQQYEKPYFDPNTPLDQDPVVNPDNNLVITYMNQSYKTLYTTKIPVIQDENKKLLYTFPMLGNLNGMDDIIRNYDGDAPAYIITHEKYNLESDGSINSYYKYDVNGNLLNTIAENTLGRIKMSPIAGQEEQWLFMKEEYDGEFFFVDLPSCETRAEISVFLEDGRSISYSIDRYPKGDSYEYAVAMLQGNNEKDGTISQDIAWLNADGSFNRYENINLGKYIEAATVNITTEALNPWLMHTDNAREYMVLVKRYNPTNTSDKETALLVCNTKGEILLDYGKSEEMGELNMVYLMDKGANPSIMCVYQKNGALTMHYTPLPLNSSSLKGSGTAEDPYQITCAYDFKLIDNNPAAYYEVANDIDFLGEPFQGPKKAFVGSLDGKNYTLDNLCLVGGGLFNSMKDSVKVRNLQIKNPVLVLSSKDLNPAGILADYMQGGVTDEGVNIYAELSNIHVWNATIKAGGYEQIVGTLVGEASLNLDVHTCSVNDALISAPSAQVGGVVGKAQTYTSVHACVFTGEAEGKVVGGITSEISSGEPVYDCRVDANFYSRNTIGGIVGYSGRSLISNCVVEGTLTLDATATTGKVGGVVGEIETDATGSSTAILVENCLVGLSAINVPEGKDVIAHRVVGFSSGDNYEYDWDKVDWSKPQSEWPRDYFAPEKGFKNNYVYSDLAAVDATIALTDTTTEGANLPISSLTNTWLAEHAFDLGVSVDAPWVLTEEGLLLWFEGELIGTNVENLLQSGISMENELLLANGAIQVYNLHGMLVAQGNNSISTSHLQAGVYIIAVSNAEGNMVQKMLLQ
ncbi:MAG: T9SS type A sorting domain-containing protein [Paludibacteraceae bacterium]|nr:T9SS type A sorting domain-containing protein [Paludibacteraceae bacterium]